MYEMNCRFDNRIADRRDQAIGRVVALLPLLPVKELDALADRLHQKLRANQGLPASQAGATVVTPASPGRQRGSQPTPEKSIDLVGQ